MSITSSEATLGAASPDLTLVSARRRGLRRFLRDRSAVAGAAVLAIVIVVAAFAPRLAPYDPTRVSFGHRFSPISAHHWLGTDNLGRDEFSRLLYGARLSLIMAVAAMAGITVLGVVLGLAAGSFGGLIDRIVMRIVDVVMALPTLVIALVVVGILGQGLLNVVIALALVGWPGYARLVRGMAISLNRREFVEAARSLGASRRRIAVREIAPNVLGTVIVLSTLDLGRTLLAVSGLSFLGFGVTEPTPEWGAMLAEARDYLDRAPQLLIYPGLAITLVVLAFNLTGDGLRDSLDPRISALPRHGGLGGWPRRWRRATDD
ncbi:MAG TPA: nickel transporter permease [Acidimicrobiales bacterium]|nr:nickel transporter permease [Acidimicrobiales bacterium]